MSLSGPSALAKLHRHNRYNHHESLDEQTSTNLLPVVQCDKFLCSLCRLRKCMINSGSG